ncbi:MAG TPA: hypothetical protein DCP92_17645 [Nitrospiraceae bacterium]|nr:hypothetical protein [Nitrospiraceae bacterium]
MLDEFLQNRLRQEKFDSFLQSPAKAQCSVRVHVFHNPNVCIYLGFLIVQYISDIENNVDKRTAINDIKKMTGRYHSRRGCRNTGECKDVPGLLKKRSDRRNTFSQSCSHSWPICRRQRWQKTTGVCII